MSKKILQKLQVTQLETAESFQKTVTADADGNLSVADLRIFGGVDGGMANSVYLPFQNIEGGGAQSIAAFKAGGGDAYNN